MTRRRVRELLLAGRTITEIARELALAKSTVCYHARQLGIAADARFARRYDWAQVQQYNDEGHTFEQCQAKFGFDAQSWYEAVKRGALVPRPRVAPIETYLVRGRRVNRLHLKGRLLREGLKQYVCDECALSDWEGERLALQLHHVNGERDDNRIENLQLLCPNCHSQTDSYGGRNSSAAARAKRVG